MARFRFFLSLPTPAHIEIWPPASGLHFFLPIFAETTPHLKEINGSEARKAIIWKSTGSWYRAEMPDGVILDCRLKGKLKLSQSGATNPVAVGDEVLVEPEPGQPGKGLITSILPRRNYLIRKSVHKTAHAQILASNLELVLVIASLTLPRTSLGFIDRLLVSAESYGIPAAIVFNKSDLLQAEELEYAELLVQMYRSIGYGACIVSVKEGLGIDTVEELLEGNTTLISGHSGVGKSSLVNAICPGLNIETQEISAFANKGKHTTTFAEMHRINSTTRIIDTPGIKELGLHEMEDDPLSHYFPEMRPFAEHCRFYNCIHVHEPGCAVLAALEDGRLPLTRYESYLSMLADEDNRR